MKYYLKPNIVSEPLVNQWYAWSFLVAPQTAAMLIANAHLKIMRSYLENPDFHRKALQQPELAGGPFIDLPERSNAAIASLLDETETHCAESLLFAKAIGELYQLLEAHPKGSSLETLYALLPEAIKGYVELVYDLQNQPSFRFIEKLLYQSPYALNHRQSVVLSEIQNDDRPFLLSTPRIVQRSQLQIKLPFSHSFYDVLYRSKHQGLDESQFQELYNLLPSHTSIDLEDFKGWFRNSSSLNNNQPLVREGNVRIRYFGHACLLIQSSTCSILVDPIISYNYSTDTPRFTYDDLPEAIDYLLITHAHQDHVLIEHLLQLRHITKTVIVPRSGGGALQDPSLKLFFEELGFKHVIEIGDMESISLPNGEVMGLPFFGEHGDLNVQTKKAHLIRLNGKSIMCAADSNNISMELYQHIHRVIGDIDCIFIGMECVGAPVSWVYGTLMPKKLERKYDQDRRLNGSNYKAAIEIINLFCPKQAFVYAMAQEPWLRYVLNLDCDPNSIQNSESARFVSECKEKGIVSERLYCKRVMEL